jgi:hypothetical protein
MVVDDNGHVVGRKSVGLDENLVVDLGIVDGDVPADDVDEAGLAVRDAKTDDVRFAGGEATGCFDGIYAKAMAIILRRKLRDLLLLAKAVKTLGRTETDVRGAGVEKLLRVLRVDRQTFRLDIRPDVSDLRDGSADEPRPFVGQQIHALKYFEKLLDGSGNEALAIGIFDTKEVLSRPLSRKQIIVQRRAKSADVEETGWRRGESGSDGHRLK